MTHQVTRIKKEMIPSPLLGHDKVHSWPTTCFMPHAWPYFTSINLKLLVEQMTEPPGNEPHWHWQVKCCAQDIWMMADKSVIPQFQSREGKRLATRLTWPSCTATAKWRIQISVHRKHRFFFKGTLGRMPAMPLCVKLVPRNFCPCGSVVSQADGSALKASK